MAKLTIKFDLGPREPERKEPLKRLVAKANRALSRLKAQLARLGGLRG